MKHKLAFFSSSLRLIYEWLFSVLISYFVLIIFMKEKPDSFMEAALLVIYTVSYMIRKKSSYNIIIFTAHLVLGGLVWLCPFSNSTSWVLTCIIIYQMSEAFLYEKNGEYASFKDVPWPTFFLSVIIYAYGYVTKSSLLTASAYIIPVVLMVLYLLIIYADGLRVYVDATKNISGLPFKKIASVNTSIVFTIVLILIFGIYIGLLFNLDDALYKALKALVYLLAYAVFALRLFFIFLLKPITQTSDEQMQYEQNKINGFASDHADDFAGILDIIYKVGTAFIIIFILYKLAVRIIKMLMKKRVVEGDLVEETFAERKKDTEHKRLSKEKKKRFSNGQKFRKLYREKVLKYKYDIRLDSYKTSADIKNELLDNEIADLTEITKAYESVRYGNKKVNREMIKMFDRW